MPLLGNDKNGPLARLFRCLPPNATVLDVGCFGFRQTVFAGSLGRSDLRHAGVDYCRPDGVPPGFDFRLGNLNSEPIPFEDDSFDLVVASHIIEHVNDPVEFFGECLRVCRPGGLIFLVSPSERSLWLPGFPFAHRSFHSLSFFDDPTHAQRPFTPISFVRLAHYFSCEEADARHSIGWLWRLSLPLTVLWALVFREAWLLERAVWRAIGWETIAAVRKPANLKGRPAFNYYIPGDRARGPLLATVRGLKKMLRKMNSDDKH